MFFRSFFILSNQFLFLFFLLLFEYINIMCVVLCFLSMSIFRTHPTRCYIFRFLLKNVSFFFSIPRAFRWCVILIMCAHVRSLEFYEYQYLYEKCFHHCILNIVHFLLIWNRCLVSFSSQHIFFFTYPLHFSGGIVFFSVCQFYPRSLFVNLICFKLRLTHIRL